MVSTRSLLNKNDKESEELNMTRGKWRKMTHY
jgi:hypothetical protein